MMEGLNNGLRSHHCKNDTGATLPYMIWHETPFGMPVYSKEYTFPVLFMLLEVSLVYCAATCMLSFIPFSDKILLPAV
jgi:hypothetical protein